MKKKKKEQKTQQIQWEQSSRSRGQKRYQQLADVKFVLSEKDYAHNQRERSFLDRGRNGRKMD